jgi:Asp-tRNA(Asn)/Glu-tRNA(Gln) amidotransferase A subunit family amidase
MTMISPDFIENDALAIGAQIRAGRTTARDVMRRTFARIRRVDAGIGAFTRLCESRALADAARIDARVAAGEDPGPLAGVPFAVKDLFDVAGLATTAGAAMRRDAPPGAARCGGDSAPVRRRRDPGRHAQHGRVRLWLLDRERPLRHDPQSA